ncbi:uncharacterized protein LOC126108155 [Schistocerca cancellata]|uniref:uncharacterized protein LOC126108155 n=1 Tax=Schistocerca cancellata TaxID=274614 RepID=UPI002119A6E2|nr:uncharacterized protein LOC126108155 [Schistocerca cancellata]
MNELKKQLVWNAVPTLFDVPKKSQQVPLERKLPQTHRKTMPRAKKLFFATKVTPPSKTSKSSIQSRFEYEMFETVECNLQSPEDDKGSDVISDPQMFEAVECKVEPHEENTGFDTVPDPQMFEAVQCKAEPHEDNTESDRVPEPEFFEGVECKVEPREDDTRSDSPSEPEDFVFVTVKTEPSQESTANTSLDVFEASASATEGAVSTKTGGGAAPHPSPALPSVTGRKQKAIIHSQARKIILNVAYCCDLEKQKKQLIFPLNEPLKRAAVYTGRTVESLLELRESPAADAGGSSPTPVPNKKRKLNDEKIDDFDEGVLRETIEEFYTVRKAVPTLGKLVSALREKTGLECESAALRKRLKSMGFVWRKVEEEDGRTFLLERFSLVRWRSRFIVRMKHAREVGREIFYLDESWIDTGLNCGKCRDGKAAGGGGALVVRSVGSRKGFVREAQLSFRVASAKKWTGTADFEKWFETGVLPNLPPESAVVVDGAPHHCRRADPAPCVYDPKSHMVTWLRRRGVACDETVMKYVLWELIRANGGSRKDYIVDQMASVRGHSVVRLPPNVRGLSAADLAWEKVVKYVRQHTAPGLSFAKLQKAVTAAFQRVTATDWEGYCGKVRVVEEDYWRRDGVAEEAVDDVILNPGAPDSGDESEDSITEDDETESD